MPATGSTRLASAETVRMRSADVPIKAERVRPDALTVRRLPTVASGFPHVDRPDRNGRSEWLWPPSLHTATAKQANASVRRVVRL